MSPITPARIAISFAVWLGVTVLANGQQPVAAPTLLPLPMPAIVPGAPSIIPGLPAPTQWAPFPQLPTVNANPVMIVPIPTRTTLEPKIVTYEKPSNNSPTLPSGATPAVVRLPVAAEIAKPIEADKPKPDEVATPADKDKLKPTSDLAGLPSRDEVFRMISDKELDARILKDLKKSTDVKFPAPAALKSSNEAYVSRVNTYAPIQVSVEPNYVVHRRLYFEEVNSERSGWDAGPAQFLISAGYFYKDVLFLPHNIASGFWKNRYEVSSGKCMPGNPTPYYLYPPGFTVGGTLTEAVVLTGTAFIFP